MHDSWTITIKGYGPHHTEDDGCAVRMLIGWIKVLNDYHRITDVRFEHDFLDRTHFLKPYP